MASLPHHGCIKVARQPNEDGKSSLDTSTEQIIISQGDYLTMSRISQIARLLLALHGLMNIVQGLYSITNPRGWTDLAGASFAGSPAHAVQAIGTCLLAPPHNRSYHI